MITTILIFLAVLSLLVFVHELGHFLMARKMGMNVEEFGFGFPPRAIGIKKGGTIYSINWIPLGGFVKIKGESGEHRTDSDSFSSKPAWQRFLVLAAGVFMNFMLAGVLLGIGFMIGMPTAFDQDVPSNATVSDQHVIIHKVIEDSPAEDVGLAVGQRIISIDDQTFTSRSDVLAHIESRGEEEVTFTVQERGGDPVTFHAQPRVLEQTDDLAVGIAVLNAGKISYPPHIALVQGFATMGAWTWMILAAFGGMIASLFGGPAVAGAELSGPIGIAVMTGEFARAGFVYLLQFAANLSISLGIINFLPIPALDGGRVLFLLIEKVRGRAVDERMEAIVHNIGFITLLALIIVVTGFDIARFSEQLFGWII